MKIEFLIRADVPTLLWGPPGTGKTAHIHNLAHKQQAHLEVLIGSTLDAAEVGGIPYPVDGVLRRSNPDWAERIHSALAKGPAWLFLDELSCSPPAVQAALLRVVQERRVGDLDLRGCRVVAAANPADSAADGGWLSPAMAGRWAHIEWTPDAGKWIVGELGGWGRPGNQALQASRAVVCGFISKMPQTLCPPLPRGGELRGHPSPRSWSAVSRALAELPGGVDDPDAVSVTTSLVGPGAAGELCTYFSALDLPDPETVLSGSALPKRGDLVAACLSAVVARAIASGRIKEAWAVLGRARPDAAVIPGQALLAAAPEEIPDEAVALASRITKAEGSVT